MTEPIRQAYGDGKREQAVVAELKKHYSWDFYKTPPFYFMDYLVNKTTPKGYANYIGGLEIKWLNMPSTGETKFPYQKLQRMLLTEPLDDNPEAFNRICIRYTNAFLLIPAFLLRPITPKFMQTRADTNEWDHNILFTASTDFPQFLTPISIKETNTTN